ncbi:MAG TPA: hypothetical protein VJN18_31655 [Polyangiaceae bacterium]|nr:hypothetical protein [Polyangiaceae bacterium]
MPATRSLLTLSLSAALALPFALLAWQVAALVEPLAQGAAGALLQLSAPLRADSRSEPEPFGLSTYAEEPAIAAATKQAPPRGAKAAARTKAPAALFVSAATVLKLSRGTARPQGAFVAATATHPAGLRLSGVAPLGIGIEDGDILIEALGVEPRSPGQIIGAIIEARARQARYLGATLWRRGQTFRIVVEQPYLDPAAASPAAKKPSPQAGLLGSPAPS